MSFTRMKFTKDWTNAEDFPTYEDSETQVRADLQLLFDELRDFLNETLFPALEDGTGAAELRTAEGTLQEVLDGFKADIQTIAAGGVPSVSQCVSVPFAGEDWAEGEDGAFTLAIPQEVHKRYGAAFGFNLWQTAEDGTDNRTWNVLSTRAARGEDGTITLTAPERYGGVIVFFGV